MLLCLRRGLKLCGIRQHDLSEHTASGFLKHTGASINKPDFTTYVKEAHVSERHTTYDSGQLVCKFNETGWPNKIE